MEFLKIQEEDEEEIDVTTIEEPIKNPLITINSNIFEIYDRTSLPDYEQLNNPIKWNGQQFDGDDSTFLNSMEDINQIACLFKLNLESMNKTVGTILYKLVKLSDVIKRHDPDNLHKLMYELRPAMNNVYQLNRMITVIKTKIDLHSKAIVTTEKSLVHNLYLIGTMDENQLPSSSQQQLPRLSLPYLNICNFYCRLGSANILFFDKPQLSIKSVSSYIVSFIKCRRLMEDEIYSFWELCLETFQVTLLKILSPYHENLLKSISFLRPTPHINSKQLSQFVDDVAVVSSNCMTYQDWLTMTTAFPPIFFQIELENIEHLGFESKLLKK